MNLPYNRPSSALPLDVSGIVSRYAWGIVVVALLGLPGCVPADRGWVQGQLTPMQVQVAEVRDRVAVVEQQFGSLDPKMDRILAQMEQRPQQSSVQHPAGTRFTFPLPPSSHIPENLPAEASLDLTITGGQHLSPDRQYLPIEGWNSSREKRAVSSAITDQTSPIANSTMRTLKGEPC